MFKRLNLTKTKNIGMYIYLHIAFKEVDIFETLYMLVAARVATANINN